MRVSTWAKWWLVVILGLTGHLVHAQGAPVCIQDGGGSMCDPAVTYYSSGTTAGSVYYNTGPFTSPMGAASAMASWYGANGPACTSQYESCSFGILPTSASSWWNTTVDVCFGGGALCNMITGVTPYQPFSINPQSLGGAFVIWGYVGTQVSNNITQQIYYFYGGLQVGQGAICPQGDTKQLDTHLVSAYYYVCVRPNTGVPNSILNPSSTDAPNPGKTCSCNPVDYVTGMKVDHQVDLTDATPFPIQWERFYNAQAGGWHFGYDRHVLANAAMQSGNSVVTAQLIRDDGSTIDMGGTKNTNGVYAWSLKTSHYSTQSPQMIQVTMTTDTDASGNFTHFYVLNRLDELETYNGQGQLISIVNRAGHELTFQYDSQGRLITIQNDFGRALHVTYLNLQVPATFTFPNPAAASSASQPATLSNTFNRWQDFEGPQTEQYPATVSDGTSTVAYTYTASAIGANGNNPRPELTQVQQADGGVKTYVYGENLKLSVSQGAAQVTTGNGLALPTDLTGVVAEDGQRFETVFYGGGSVVNGETLGTTNVKPLVFYAATSYSSVQDAQGNTFGMNVSPYSNAITQFSSASPCPASLCQGGPTSWKLLSYDATGNPTALTDFMGTTESRTYDPVRGLLLTQAEATNQPSLTRTTTTTWDNRFRLPDTVTEPIMVNGVSGTKTTTFTYDEAGNVLTATEAPSDGEAPRVTTATYDAAGLLSTVTAPSGAVTHETYDDTTGRLLSWTDALGHTVTLSQYNEKGLPGQSTDANGLQTLYTYDQRQRVVQIQRGSSATHWETTQIVYQASGTGLVDHLVMKDGRTLALAYNSAQWLTQATEKDSTGQVMGTITYTYNGMGDMTGETWADAQGNPLKVATATFDTFHRLSTAVGSAGQTTTDTYDAQSRLIQSKDPNGNTIKRTYDALGRVATLTDALGHTATLSYDPQDALVKAVDVRGNATTYTYNGFGDRLSVASPDRGTWTFTVDGAGRRTGVTDPRGATTAVTYDLLDRPTQVIYDSTPIATGTVGVIRNTETQTFTYDTCTNGVGHLCSMTDASGTTSYTYDLWGRLTGQAFIPADNASVSLTVGYGYNTVGQLVSVVYPSGRTLVLTYGPDGQLASQTWAGAPVVMGISHRPLGGGVTGWQWGSASAGSETFTYDTDGQLVGMNDANAGGTARTLGYDPGGRLQAVTVSGQLLWNQGYTYDANDRLTGATLGGFPGSLSYGYDFNGNRTSFGNNGTTLTNTYAPTSNRVLSYQVAPGAAATPVWDAAGNLINDGQGLALAYDAKNRLVQANNAGLAVSYAYDAAGNRVEKNVQLGPGAGVERYVYDPSGLLLGVYDINGNPIEETAYLDDDRPVALARPVSGQSGSWTVYPILTDQLGTPRQILDPTLGSPVWEWEAKEPFGSELPNQTISGNTFIYRGRFPGQVFDPDTGLVHNGFRDYEPALGRYIQSDPEGLEAGWNTYTYTASTPVNAVDFDGLDCNVRGCWNTPAETDAAKNGDYKSYYALSCAGGDPYACRAGEVASNSSNLPLLRRILTMVTNEDLALSIRLMMPKDVGCPEKYVEEKMNGVRTELARARARQLARASSDVPLMVNKSSIATFHREVFKSNGSAGWVFGGTLFDNVISPAVLIDSAQVTGGAMLVNPKNYYNWCPFPACKD